MAIKNQTILITGCTGFIGSNIAEQLLLNDNLIIGIDNNNDFLYPSLFKKKRLEKLKKYKNFDFREYDICSSPLIEIISKKYKLDAVFHLAGHAGVRTSLDNPNLYFENNTIGTLKILEALKNKIKKIIFASTSSVYGNNIPPFNEEQKTDIQLSPYAASKRSAETIISTYHSLYDIDASVLRYFTVYGPSGRPDMSVLRFIYNIDNGIPIDVFGDGEQERDFTYIDDIVNGSILSIQQKGFEIFNLGSDNPVKLRKIIDLIENNLNKVAIRNYKERHPTDILKTCADISKTREMLKWEPKFSIEEGIKNTVEWYIENKDWIKM